MSAVMPPPMPPAQPAPPMPEQGGGIEAEIPQIMQDTGYDEQRIRSDIARTGAQSKEQLYPQLYSAEGIQPQGPPEPDADQQGGPPDQDVDDQGAPPMDNRMQAQAAMGAPAGAPPADDMQIPPDIAQAMHQQLAPSRHRPPMRPGVPRHTVPHTAPAHNRRPPAMPRRPKY